MSSYVMYCRAQAAECVRRAKLASSPELAAERQRITSQFEASGAFGLSPAEKAERVSEVRQRQRQLLAQLELQWRKAEADAGELVAHANRSAEMFLLTDADLEREAA